MALASSGVTKCNEGKAKFHPDWLGSIVDVVSLSDFEGWSIPLDWRSKGLFVPAHVENKVVYDFKFSFSGLLLPRLWQLTPSSRSSWRGKDNQLVHLINNQVHCLICAHAWDTSGMKIVMNAILNARF